MRVYSNKWISLQFLLHRLNDQCNNGAHIVAQPIHSQFTKALKNYFQGQTLFKSWIFGLLIQPNRPRLLFGFTVVPSRGGDKADATSYANVVNAGLESGVSFAAVNFCLITDGVLAADILRDGARAVQFLSSQKQDLLMAFFYRHLKASRPPEIESNASAAPKPVRVGKVVTFSVSAIDPEGGELTFTWDFGDGTAGSGATVDHTYMTVGSFTATVTVTDESGKSVTSATTLNVRDLLDQDNDGYPDDLKTALVLCQC